MIDWFEGYDMAGTYNERVVENTKTEVFTMDTALVTDRGWRRLYETAISHVDFNDGDWIVLGWSETRDEAAEYHNEMVEKYLKNDYITIADAYTGEVFERGEDLI